MTNRASGRKSKKPVIVEKCWSFVCHSDGAYSGHIYGETRSKAIYKFYRETDGYDFLEFVGNFSFRRHAYMDYLAPIPMDDIIKN